MSETHAAAVATCLDALAKPRGSLGRLETLAIALARAQRTERPSARPRRLVLFAADHGCVASGVSAWPSAVTGAMIATILEGGAASAVLARTTGTDLRLVDVGSLAEPPPAPPAGYLDARGQRGSADLAHGPALSAAEFDVAWTVGADEAERAHKEGFTVVAAGEIGIGNTTPAACLTALLAGVPIDIAAGRGAGADDATLAIKRIIVSRAVERETAVFDANPRAAIAAVAGYEIAAMAGFFARAAELPVAVVLDGYVATAAALVAERFAPGSTRMMIAAHRSAEPGHAAALAYLGLVPLLALDMRLGEGTGALTAIPLLDMATAVLDGMTRLDAIGAGG